MLDAKSAARLAAAWPTLSKLFTACAADPMCPYPFTVLDAQRNKADQEKAFALGHSRAHFGQSAHNWTPALALDVVPFAAGKAIDWSNTARFKAFAAYVKRKANDMGVPVTWGGDWKSIKDMPHWEIPTWRDLVAAKKVKPYGA